MHVTTFDASERGCSLWYFCALHVRSSCNLVPRSMASHVLGLTSQLGWRLLETWWNGLKLGFPEDARHTPYIRSEAKLLPLDTTKYTFLSTYGPKEWFYRAVSRQLTCISANSWRQLWVLHPVKNCLKSWRCSPGSLDHISRKEISTHIL
jgi:hypothetical protein